MSFVKERGSKLAACFLFLLVLSGCGYESVQNAQSTATPKVAPTIQMARKIKINQLKGELTRLKNHETEYDFIGITSNGVDCLYFVSDGDNFNLEFEAMISDQKPFIDKLREWADSNHFKSAMTTYNNQPKYQSDQPAPVIHIETNASLEVVVKLGSRIEKEIFGNSETAVYEVVP
jgi:hypothetical protein